MLVVSCIPRRTTNRLQLTLLDDHFLLAAAAGDDDFAGVFEAADDINDFLLGGFHVADADGTHVLHVFLDELGGTFGHIFEDLLLEVFAGGFEGEGNAQLVMSYRDEANATYVGLQQFVGKIGDRSGTFVCKVDGEFEGGEAKSTWKVVPGSGTGDLAGISGQGETTAVHGDIQPYTFVYSFE